MFGIHSVEELIEHQYLISIYLKDETFEFALAIFTTKTIRDD